MARTDANGSLPPTEAQPPRGINHLVLNVRDLEVSHTFWTEIMGFRCVAELRARPGVELPKMRFYSGLDEHGDVNHHDLALAEIVPDGDRSDQGPWTIIPGRVRMNHVAITWPDRDSWLKQVAFLQSKGVPFHWRVNHGMSHSVYVSDPDGYGIEVLYEMPWEIWAKDIEGAQNFLEVLPSDGPEALVDRTDYPVFDGATEAAGRRA